jgi:chemotaxis protein histidine kinase CheA
MSTTPQFEHAMRALSAKFSGELPHKLQEIHRLYLATMQNAYDDAALNRLHRALHSLAGAARAFGHPQISDAAQNLEQCIAELLTPALSTTGTIALLQIAMDNFLEHCLDQKAA